MISLCLTNYNRYEMLMQAFGNVIDSPVISEIIISDDCSDYQHFSKVQAACNEIKKVRLFRNQENMGMARNKAKVLTYAINDWCILFDSDNVIDLNYIDAIPKKLESDVIYCPDFARPEFDYTKFAGKKFNKQNISQLISNPMGNCLVNTCNYLVHKESYLKCFTYNDIHTSTDTVWFNYCWLKTLGSFYVVPGMQYFHRVHAGSAFLADVDNNMVKAEHVKKLMLAM